MKEGSKVPRRGNVPKREILPDPVYNSVLVTKLINGVMLDGKKGVAQKVVYDAFDTDPEEDRISDPLEVFTEALEQHHARLWKSRPAVSAAPPTRCLSRFVRSVVRPSVSAGWSATPASAAKRP